MRRLNRALVGHYKRKRLSEAGLLKIYFYGSTMKEKEFSLGIKVV